MFIRYPIPLGKLITVRVQYWLLRSNVSFTGVETKKWGRQPSRLSRVVGERATQTSSKCSSGDRVVSFVQARSLYKCWHNRYHLPMATQRLFAEVLRNTCVWSFVLFGTTSKIRKHHVEVKFWRCFYVDVLEFQGNVFLTHVCASKIRDNISSATSISGIQTQNHICD